MIFKEWLDTHWSDLYAELQEHSIVINDNIVYEQEEAFR